MFNKWLHLIRLQISVRKGNVKKEECLLPHSVPRLSHATGIEQILAKSLLDKYTGERIRIKRLDDSNQTL